MEQNSMTKIIKKWKEEYNILKYNTIQQYEKKSREGEEKKRIK